MHSQAAVGCQAAICGHGSAPTILVGRPSPEPPSDCDYGNKGTLPHLEREPSVGGACGYSFLESRGKSLGSLLKGEETDALAATNLISKLLQGEKDVGTTLVNYNKDGRRFTNRVRVGPIYDEDHNVTHFVGVLQEVKV